ncbi:uncharacterized protein [Linepithema humile]|uniref:uncharacterized protein n=1 Tax=Linepithema humile TaxID=83485 RepID=UPI00351F61A3
MSFYDNRYYQLNKRLLSVIGQWPFQPRREANVMFAITAFFIFSLTVLEFWGLISGITDLSIIMENVSPLLVNSLVIIKLVNCLFNKYKMKNLLEDVEETWKIIQVGPENKILRNYAEQCRTNTIEYAIGLYITSFSYSTMPIVVSGVYYFLPTNETYTARFLYRLEHVVDVNKYFNLLMLHAIVSIFYIISVPIAIDTLYVLCTQHVCALFENIRYNMERIQDLHFDMLEPDIADDKAYHIIIDCIKSYNRAIKFTDLLSATYATSFFFQLGNVIISLSFSAAELIMVDNQLDEIIRIVCANVAQLIHIFYLCLTSQRLIDYSSGLQRVIYSSNWYMISLRSRQLLKFMLLRTTKPCQIKAGKMYVMSLENFSSILQVSTHFSSRKPGKMNTEYYKINQLFMSWIGQWPEQSSINRFFLSFNLIFAICSQLCLQVCGLIAVWQDWDRVIECSTPIMIHMLCFVKFLNYFVNTQKFKKLFMQLKNTWKLVSFDAQIQILKTYTNEGRKMTKIYAIIMYSSTFMYMILPVIPSIMTFLTNANQTKVHGLLYHVETVVDTEKYYYFILLHSYYSTFFVMTIPVATDPMLIVCVQHACGLFAAIGYQLENMNRNDNIDVNVYPLIEDDEHYRIICDSIAKHREILQFTKSLASSYSTTFLVLTILNVAIVTFSGVQTVTNLDRPTEAFRFAVTGVCLMMHFLFLSLPGQKLIDHSSSMHQAIYAANWYTISLKARKLLNFMLMRCEIPCQITVGKMSVMSLRSFSRVRRYRDNVSFAISTILSLTEFFINLKTGRRHRQCNSRNQIVKMNSLPNDIFQSRQYKFNRVLLSLLGQWPFQKDRDRRIAFIIVSFIGITQAITKVLAIMTLRGDLNAILECVAPLLIDGVCIVKLTNLMLNTKKIKILLLHMQRDWKSWTIESELEILYKFAESGRSITVGYAGGIYAFGSLFPFLAIIPKIIGKNIESNYSTRPVGFPYHVEYYIDLEKYYYPVLIHNYLATAVRLTIIVASDACVAILVQHCCALFSMARYRLEHIKKSIEQDKELALLEEDDKIYKNFVYCIRKHEDALQFAKCLETIYKKALFMEVGMIILIMSLSALQATTDTFTPQLALRHGGYIAAQLLHLFIACWLGQQIVDHSDGVYTSIYAGEWYESPSKSKKLLNMIMLRSTIPCTLTVGKIMVLSLPSFSAVIFLLYILHKIYMFIVHLLS